MDRLYYHVFLEKIDTNIDDDMEDYSLIAKFESLSHALMFMKAFVYEFDADMLPNTKITIQEELVPGNYREVASAEVK